MVTTAIRVRVCGPAQLPACAGLTIGLHTYRLGGPPPEPDAVHDEHGSDGDDDQSNQRNTHDSRPFRSSSGSRSAGTAALSPNPVKAP
jgi:hypothetical protein